MPERTLLVVEIDASPGAPPIDAKRLARLLSFAAGAEGGSGEAVIWLCTDAEIADLHQRFMGLSGPTDVMSFPGDPPGAADRHLGDVAVSFETADRQAPEFGNDVAREIAYLALHGLLHLLGYDDLDESDRRCMITRQDELLDTFEQDHSGAWS